MTVDGSTEPGFPELAIKRMRQIAAIALGGFAEVLLTATVCSGLQKRLSPLVPAAAQSRKSTCVRLAAIGRSKLSRNVERLIDSGALVGRRCRGRAVFARGDSLVEQHSDFFANDVARRTGPAPSVAYFRRRCSKEFSFQGVEQRRQSGLRITYAGHGQDQTKPWRSRVRRIRLRVVSYSTAVRS